MRLGRPVPPIVLTTDERETLERWARRPSPTLGEHNDEVLGEVAGVEELQQLRAAGVIGDRIVSR